MKKSYVSQKVELRKSKIGKGLFAKEKIDKGELVIDFSTGSGTILKVGEPYEKKLFADGYDYMVQISDKEMFAATTNEELEDADFINHSCAPNCGIRGSLQIVAMRNIEPGEEITFDYAMTESTKYSIKCGCGAKSCRKLVTGDDWKIPELQKKYCGYFSDYLQTKIKC